MSSWPTSLPQTVLVSGKSGKQLDNRIVTSMETGKPKIAIRYTAVPTNYNVRLVLTSAQVDTLMAFYNTVIEFDWVHPRTNNAATCRILTTPTDSQVGRDLYNVTFQLEVTTP